MVVPARGAQPWPLAAEPAQAHYDAHSSLMSQTPEGVLIVPEDKSPQESYIRSEEGHFWNFRKELDASGWTPQEGVTPEQAEKATRSELIQALLTRFSFLRTQIKKWSKRCSPTGYTSIKRKCFADGRRVCSTPNQACIRKIASYSTTWGKTPATSDT